jgi:hypothetical protein
MKRDDFLEGGQRRSASVPVSGSVSAQRVAARVGGLRERPTARGALTPSPHAARLSPAAHELAHALAHAAREPPAAGRPFGRPEFPDKL